MKNGGLIGLGIFLASIPISAAWLEINGKEAGGLWLLAIIIVLFGTWKT